ncbi:MAG: hypothetical protein U0637_03215 [Phycisphaerales bacterium]
MHLWRLQLNEITTPAAGSLPSMAQSHGCEWSSSGNGEGLIVARRATRMELMHRSGRASFPIVVVTVQHSAGVSNLDCQLNSAGLLCVLWISMSGVAVLILRACVPVIMYPRHLTSGPGPLTGYIVATLLTFAFTAAWLMLTRKIIGVLLDVLRIWILRSALQNALQ